MKMTPSFLRTAVKGLFILAIAALLGYSISRGQGQLPSTGQIDLEKLDRDYQISADPEFEVLQLKILGGSSLRWKTFKLFADGRLTIDLIWPGTGEVVESYLVILTFQELEALVSPLVNAGFMEANDRTIHRELEDRYGSPNLDRLSNQSSKTILTLNLERYSVTGQGDQSDISNSVGLYAPSYLSEKYPGAPLLDALAYVTERLKQYRRDAQRGQDESQ